MRSADHGAQPPLPRRPPRCLPGLLASPPFPACPHRFAPPPSASSGVKHGGSVQLLRASSQLTDCPRTARRSSSPRPGHREARALQRLRPAQGVCIPVGPAGPPERSSRRAPVVRVHRLLPSLLQAVPPSLPSHDRARPRQAVPLHRVQQVHVSTRASPEPPAQGPPRAGRGGRR